MNPNTRPISIPHLVFGLVFLGIAAVWGLGEATDADLPNTAMGFPAVLIGAGVVGLVATVINNRRRSREATASYVEDQPATEAATEPTESTVVLDDAAEETPVVPESTDDNETKELDR